VCVCVCVFFGDEGVKLFTFPIIRVMCFIQVHNFCTTFEKKHSRESCLFTFAKREEKQQRDLNIEGKGMK